MNSIEQIFQNESLIDIVMAFGTVMDYPSLDRMFSRYRFEVIASGELLKAYQTLFKEGVLANGDGPVAVKGPNWKAPNFVTAKKYV